MRNQWRVLRLSVISFLTTFVLSSLLASPSVAHWADLSVAEVVVGETNTQITLTLPTSLVTFADDNQNGHLSPEEVRQHPEELQTFVGDRLHLTDSQMGKGKLTVQPSEAATLTPDLQSPETHSTLHLTYTWPEPLQDLRITYNLFVPEVSTARCLATILDGDHAQNFVFTPESRMFVLRSNSIWQQARSFILLGFEHILVGYDHILFLLALMLMGGKLLNVIKMVTAFTIAHSLTLYLAVFNIVVLPAWLVESIIALSIVYVAAENLWRRPGQHHFQHRWLLTFGFGLIHGLGFAGILQDFDLSSTNLALSLASFNVGVEIGQIIIVSVAFLLLQIIRKRPWTLIFRRSASVAMVAIGLVWFTQRIFSIL